MKINVLVTGANGQLAKTIKALYSKNTEGIDFTFTTKAELNITNINEIEDNFNKTKFHYCINCAAYTNVEQAETTPEIALKINAEAVKYLAQACKKTNTILIHISTDYVFDGEKTSPYTEEDIPNPINEYGKSKLLGEQYVRQTLDKYFIIRTSWLYSVYGNNFVKTIINKINEAEKLKVTTSQTGVPTSCEDLALLIIHLIITAQDQYGVYNFSAQGEVTWYDFALQIAKHFAKYDTSYISPVKTFLSKVKRPIFSVLDNSKSEYLFSKKINWRKSVDKVVKNLNNTQKGS